MQHSRSSEFSFGIEGWGSVGLQVIAMVSTRGGFCGREVVCDSTTPGEKLDLLLYLVLGKGQA